MFTFHRKGGETFYLKIQSKGKEGGVCVNFPYFIIGKGLVERCADRRVSGFCSSPAKKCISAVIHLRVLMHLCMNIRSGTHETLLVGGKWLDQQIDK